MLITIQQSIWVILMLLDGFDRADALTWSLLGRTALQKTERAAAANQRIVAGCTDLDQASLRLRSC